MALQIQGIMKVFLYPSVDNVGPTNIQRGLPNIRSQLDLAPFGVGACNHADENLM